MADDRALTQVTKRFGTLRAVDAVDLEVAAGEVVCLLGPSGCGKTTTLRMIAGLETATERRDPARPAGGSTSCAARERNIAMVFQFYALYPSLTVRENLAYPAARRAARPRRDRAPGRRDRARAAARPRCSTGCPASSPRARSSGSRSAAAIIRDPSCFLFDEPLSRLDVAAARADARQDQGGAAGPATRPTVIVTHDQLEALTMADRIAVMRAGRIEQIATPARDLRQARQPVRRRLHRHAADEPDAGRYGRPGELRERPLQGRRARRSRCRWPAPTVRLRAGRRGDPGHPPARLRAGLASRGATR